MKRNFLRFSFIIVLLSFMWGLWWGFYQNYQSRPESWARGEINILAEEGRFSPEFIQQFSSDERVILKITTRPTPQLYLQEMLSQPQKYDLFEFNSFMVDSFIMDNVFQEL